MTGKSDQWLIEFIAITGFLAITAIFIRLPPECETDLLERFLKAEAMALWTVRSARLQDVPPHVYAFLRKHEEDEQQRQGADGKPHARGRHQQD